MTGEFLHPDYQKLLTENEDLNSTNMALRQIIENQDKELDDLYERLREIREKATTD